MHVVHFFRSKLKCDFAFNKRCIAFPTIFLYSLCQNDGYISCPFILAFQRMHCRETHDSDSREEWHLPL